MKKQVELSITHNGKDVVAYPYTKKEHVQFENGMNIDEFVGQDIATPTITHDTTAIKVGVGDSDVSSSVVDSAVNMTIKGQTYQNILPEPTLRNEMQGKSMQRLNEGYDSIETVDGVSKSAILKGQTLVNLTQPSLRAWTMNLNSDTASLKATPDEFIIDWSKGVPYNAWIQARNDNAPIFGGMIKPNTEYTFIINILENNPTFEGNKVTSDVARFQIWGLKTHQSESNYLRGGITGRVAFKYNFNRVTEGTIENVFGIAVSGTSANGTKTIDGGKLRISKDIIILEGDYTENYQDIPYFEGMQSVKMPVLTTYGDNIFDNNNIIVGSYYGSDGKIISNSTSILSTTYISIEPNAQLISNISRSSYQIVEYDSNKNFITRQNAIPNNPATLSSNTRYVRFSFYDCGTDFNCYVRKGLIKPLVYEPFKSNILTTPEEVVLKGIGDVQDTLNCNTGEYIQRIGEMVLDGSSDETITMWFNKENNAYFGIGKINNVYKPRYEKICTVCDKLPTPDVNPKQFEEGDYEGVSVWDNNLPIIIGINKNRLQDTTVSAFRQWLQQNPIKIQYQLETPVVKTVDLSIVDQDDNTQENLNFFANGHIQVSSGENSLLPFVQYEIPTKNSYHMDLMKANTQYTMKSKSASGAFTIDGTSYEAGINGTFTTPTSMTNKLLVMSNKTNEEVMIIEGDVVSKTIPYFKGIKSAFEDENKIEVLSTGKNLFDMNRRYDNITNAQATVVQNVDKITVSSVEDGTYVNANFVLDKNFFKGKTVVGGCLYESDEKGIGTVQINYQDTTGKKYYQSIKTSRTFTFPDEFVGEVLLCVYANNTNTPQSNTVTVRNIQLELGTKSTTYNSHKSNTTKIPLLSPLRSLPNGICDELIIDRLNHKAKLIQRIGYEVLNENTAFSSYPTMEKEKTLLFQTQNANPQGASTYCISDQFIHRNNLGDRSDSDTEAIMIGGGEGNIGKRIDFRISKAKVSTNNVTILQSYLSKEPITVLYQLNTPIITEIDLEGFPYIYKDGHIFLNSEIAPTTQITYNINQSHQIESANENLQRHEKEISRLQKLIAQYIQVEYESTLLSLKI